MSDEPKRVTPCKVTFGGYSTPCEFQDISVFNNDSPSAWCTYTRSILLTVDGSCIEFYTDEVGVNKLREALGKDPEEHKKNTEKRLIIAMKEARKCGINWQDVKLADTL